MTSAFRWSAVTVDCIDPPVLAEFWREVLGGEISESLPGWRRVDTGRPGIPWITFQPVPEPKVTKNRIHLDLVADELDIATATVVGAGGTVTGEQHRYPEGVVTVMADPEGNEFCVVVYSDDARH